KTRMDTTASSEVRAGQISDNSACLRVDPEFAALDAPLGRSALRQLEAELLSAGCLKPLIVWQEHNILLAGHDCYQLCCEHDIEFRVEKLALADRATAKRWLI